MHLVRYHVAVSLDGFIAPLDGATEWLEPYGKVAMGFIGPWMKQIGGIIVGRVTYDQSIGMGGWMWGKTPAWDACTCPTLGCAKPDWTRKYSSPNLFTTRLCKAWCNACWMKLTACMPKPMPSRERECLQ